MIFIVSVMMIIMAMRIIILIRIQELG